MEVALARSVGCEGYDYLAAQAERVAPGSEGLIFLPYLAGERPPPADPFARGAWIGLTSRHTKGHLVRAVLEGVAFALKDALDAIQDPGLPGGRGTPRARIPQYFFLA